MSREGELVVVSERPLNAETPLAALDGGVTPAASFFVRCNFDVPDLDAATWRLDVGGLVDAPRSFALHELQALPHRQVLATLECAGNGRRLMQPVPAGTAWSLGAVSTGVFGGTSLRDVLELCGIRTDAVEIVCEGADSGAVDDGRVVPFVRSLPLQKAMQPDTLLAWSLNGAPLPPEHGYPLRVLVPGWYGVASVKWLTRLEAVARPFSGHFQTDRYVYRGHPARAQDAPVTQMEVRALLTRATPAADGAVDLAGIAWSGAAAIARVQVSDDDGVTWHDALLEQPSSQYAACSWRLRWPAAGDVSGAADAGGRVFCVRATDRAGNAQPLDPVWNELGYGNNVVQRVRVPAMHGL